MSKKNKKASKTTGPLAIERILHSQGFGSRHECRGLCLQGRVSINNRLIKDPDEPVIPAEGLIYSVDGHSWPYHAKAYIALHKPAGYECSHKPIHYPSIYTLLPSPLRLRNVQAAGRLDADTTGLLLMSDDGQFIHRTISGKRHLPKNYIVTTKHPVTPQMRLQLLNGVMLDDEPAPVSASECHIIGENQLSLTITTGKYHQVKRMIAAASNRVTALHRNKVGQFELPQNLQPAQWQWITPEQVFE